MKKKKKKAKNSVQQAKFNIPNWIIFSLFPNAYLHLIYHIELRFISQFILNNKHDSQTI